MSHPVCPDVYQVTVGRDAGQMKLYETSNNNRTISAGSEGAVCVEGAVSIGVNDVFIGPICRVGIWSLVMGIWPSGCDAQI